jgi:uncharacterized integral membrane protein
MLFAMLERRAKDEEDFHIHHTRYGHTWMLIIIALILFALLLYFGK